MQTENIGNRSGAADYGHVSFVEIVERVLGFFAFNAGLDGFGGVGSTLNGDLSDTGQGLAVFFIRGVSEIADDKYVGVIGDGEIGIYFDAAAFIGFGVSALGQFFFRRWWFRLRQPRGRCAQRDFRFCHRGGKWRRWRRCW